MAPFFLETSIKVLPRGLAHLDFRNPLDVVEPRPRPVVRTADHFGPREVASDDWLDYAADVKHGLAFVQAEKDFD